MEIMTNSILVPAEECGDEIPFSGPHRVLGIDKKHDTIILFNLMLEEGATESTERKYAAPFSCSFSMVVGLHSEGKLRIGELVIPGYMLTEDLSPKDKKRFDQRLAIVAPFLDSDNRGWIFDPQLRGQLVTRQMEATGKRRKAILRLLYKLLAFGLAPCALYPGFSQCGGRGKERKTAREKALEQATLRNEQIVLEEIPDIKRGRPRKVVTTGHDPSNTGINVTTEMARIFQTFTDKYFNKSSKRPFSYVFGKIIEELYSVVRLFSDGKKETIVDPNSPTIEQYKYWYEKTNDPQKSQLARVGARRVALKYRELGGSVSEDCSGPTARYEMDSTVLDVYLVSLLNRHWIIGRPILYFLVDVYSRMIVGFHLALQGPKWTEARIALFNAFTDKVSFCRHYGVDISDADWPVHHLPQVVLVDRGELRAHKPKSLIDNMGIEIVLAPSFRGDLKPLVERRFRIINDLVIHWTPGAVRARERERGDRDCRLDACLTMHDVTKIVIQAILYHNHKLEFPDLLNREMLADGVSVATPINLWNWGMSNALGSPRAFDRRSVFCHLLPSGDAIVRADGLWWKGIKYKCDSLVANKWRWAARNNGNWTVTIRYLPNSSNNIWLFDKTDGSFEQCDFMSKHERFRDCRFEEVVDCLAYLSLEKSNRKYSDIGASIDMDCGYEEVIASAIQAKASQVSPPTQAAALSGIQEHRQKEDLLRVLEAFSGDPALVRAIQDPQGQDIDPDEAAYRDEISTLLAGIADEEMSDER